MLRKERFPKWLRKSLNASSSKVTNKILKEVGVNTVCQSALCPNKNECFSR